MISEVAAYLGGTEDPATRERALAALDRAADTCNMHSIFLFQQREATFTDLEEAQATLTLPADWGWPTPLISIYNSAGEKIWLGRWMSWENWQNYNRPTAGPSIPELFTIRTELAPSGQVLMFPAVALDKVGSIKLDYIARISRPSEAETGSAIWATPEVRETLIRGGVFFAMQLRYQDRPAIWAPYEALFMKGLRASEGASMRFQSATAPAFAPDMPDSASPYQTAPFGGPPTFLQI